jgi:hypothetical protein
VETAAKAARFVHQTLWDPSTRLLLRRFRDGEAAIPGFLDDYACLANAAIDLYETSFQPGDLAWALDLAGRARELFEDPAGGFYSTPERQADLVMRLKDDYDGAEPSGNSALALALLRLARITGREELRASAESALRAFAPKMRQAGSALPQMLVARMFSLARPMEIVLAGELDAPMLGAIRARFLPQSVVVRAADAPHPMPASEGRPTVYVCENFACQLPVTDVNSLEALLPAPLQ